MSTSRQAFPSFDYPPVVETVLGIEFEPLDKWSIIHFGLLQDELKFDYPHYEIQPPIGSQSLIEFGFPDKLPVRIWFLNELENKLLQIQNNRFIYNWRQINSDDKYPRYRNIKTLLETEWLRFCGFLKSHNIESPKVQRCELTYINHIEAGEGWRTLKDIGNIFPYFSSDNASGLPEPESINSQFVYRTFNEGKLVVQLQSVRRVVDDKDILQFQLTLIGNPKSSETEELLKWFDTARETIVLSFLELTSPQIHNIWMRTE